MAKNIPENDIKPEIAWKDFQYNMSAVLYLITEQQALIGRLLEELVRVGALNNDSLQRITETHTDSESISGIYTDLYKKFAGYVLLSKNVLEKVERKDEDE